MGVFDTLNNSLPPVTVTGSAVVSEAMKFLKLGEGFRANAYKDPLSKNGLPITIGYGTTQINGKPVSLGTTITEPEAKALLIARIKKDIEAIKKKVKVSLTTPQMVAAVSIVYNCGAGVLNDKLFTLINQRASPETIAAQWVKTRPTSGGVWNEALYKRRVKEAEKFTGVKVIAGTKAAATGTKAAAKFDIKKYLPLLLLAGVALFIAFKKK